MRKLLPPRLMTDEESGVVDQLRGGNTIQIYQPKRSPNWTILEIQTLCDFVREHKDQLFICGQNGSKKGVNATKKEHWELAASLINAKARSNRHWSQVRKKWKDLSYSARTCNKKNVVSNNPGNEEQDQETEEQPEIPLSEIRDINEIGNDNVSSASTDTTYSSSPSDDASAASSTLVPPVSSDVNVKSEPDLMILSEHSQAKLCNNADAAATASAVVINNLSSASCLDVFHGDADLESLQGDTHQTTELASLHANSGSTCALMDGTLQRPQSHARPGFNGHSSVVTDLTHYQLSRLQIEREKLRIQKRALRCLRDIAYDLSNLNAGFAQLKRRRRGAGACRLSFKRRRAQVKSKCETDSTDFEC